MPVTVLGRDSIAQSTPFDLMRGSRTTLRRTLYDYNVDTGQESQLDVSATNADPAIYDIVWKLTKDLQSATVATLTKKYSVSTGVTLVNGGGDGQIQIIVDDSDTTSLAIGYYWAQIAVTLASQTYKLKPAQVCLKASS